MALIFLIIPDPKPQGTARHPCWGQGSVVVLHRRKISVLDLDLQTASRFATWAIVGQFPQLQHLIPGPSSSARYVVFPLHLHCQNGPGIRPEYTLANSGSLIPGPMHSPDTTKRPRFIGPGISSGCLKGDAYCLYNQKLSQQIRNGVW